ncbi:MarR family winged helix-turn-helix transcriptional regulator [Runella limosa]|uniref:MarR family winged helix-turn-helix transcriptional regulator n=1 Tax=Runella limosa TaxID=370978 RepID=UPI000490F7BA|nr:winged helix DNA-binding protein [Runella limosa]
MNYALLQELIGHLANYEAQRSPLQRKDMEGFVAYLNQQVFAKSSDPELKFENGETVEVLLSQLVAFLYRYAKGYIKKALDSAHLITIDDFSYLAGIWQTGGCTKTEIIDMNIHEKTTGMEVIKRLLNNGLIEQTDDPKDRRSKRLLITGKGMGVLFGTFEEMRKASLIIAGTLNEAEKMQLLHLLQKLHFFHKPLFLNERDTGLDGLLTIVEAAK